MTVYDLCVESVEPAVASISVSGVGSVQLHVMDKVLLFHRFSLCCLVHQRYEPRHEISNNVVCATRMIRAFASCLNIL